MAGLPPPSPPPGVLLSELPLGPRVRIRPLTRHQPGVPHGQPAPPPELCIVKGGLAEGHWSRPVVAGGQAHRPALVSSNSIEIMEPIMNMRLYKSAPRYFRFAHDDYNTIQRGLNVAEDDETEVKSLSKRKKGLRSHLKKLKAKMDHCPARRRMDQDVDAMAPTDTPQSQQSIESWCARVRYRPSPGKEQQLLALVVIPGKIKNVRKMLQRDNIPYREEEEHYAVEPDLLISPHRKEEINFVDVSSSQSSGVQDEDDDEADWETTDSSD